MATLTLDVGGTNLTVACVKAGHAAPRRVGARGYSASGQETSQIARELMVVPLILAMLPTSTVATIRALFALGTAISCQGDVFVNASAVVACSGMITDELQETADRWTITLTLYEVGTASTFTPATTLFLLTSVTSPDDATALVSTPNGSYLGDFPSGLSLGASLVPPTATCPTSPGVVVTPTPQAKHLSVPLKAGFAYGTPSIRVETGIVNGTVWDTSSFMAKLSLKRAGSIVAGPWSSSWGAMGVLTSNTDTITFPTAIAIPLVNGDQFLIEWYARVGLGCNQTDNAQRPFIYTGAVPGPRQNPVLFIGGNITSYP